MANVEQFLQSHHIEYILHEHPAVFTCEEAEKHCVNVPGLAGKNLFLRSEKSARYFLVVLPAAKRADLKKVAEMVGERRISFANADILREKLGLEPGSVSPFGLITLYRDGRVIEPPLYPVEGYRYTPLVFHE